MKDFDKILKEAKRKKTKDMLLSREWYLLQSILGYSWALFYFLLGGREAGKSYATTYFFVQQFVKYGRPFYWLRLSETSTKKLLMNNAEKLIDPDIRREFDLDLITNGDCVYCVKKRSKPDKNGKTKVLKKVLMARVLSIATYYNDKGSGLFDKDFLLNPNMYYNICLDEMNREKSEKNSFDIVYSFTNQLENLIRSTKNKVRVICIGNTLEEASDLLCSFNFLPEEFGRYKLVRNKKLLMQMLKELNEATTDKERQEINKRYANINFGKRAVIEYIEPNEAYTNRRHGTISDILMPHASTFTNKIDTDNTLVNKKRLKKPIQVIKFSKEKENWFTLWDDGIINEYKGENKPVIAMKPYIDEIFQAKTRDMVILNFDTRAYQYHSLILFKRFQKNINLLKPRGN